MKKLVSILNLQNIQALCQRAGAHVMRSRPQEERKPSGVAVQWCGSPAVVQWWSKSSGAVVQWSVFLLCMNLFASNVPLYDVSGLPLSCLCLLHVLVASLLLSVCMLFVAVSPFVSCLCLSGIAF